MTRSARATALGIGALALAGGLILRAFGGAGWGLLAIGALVIVSVLLEPRYKRRRDGLPGAGWQRTGEREIDNESGAVRDVWFDPLTGERRHVPVESPTGSLPQA